MTKFSSLSEGFKQTFGPRFVLFLTALLYAHYAFPQTAAVITNCNNEMPGSITITAPSGYATVNWFNNTKPYLGSVGSGKTLTITDNFGDSYSYIPQGQSQHEMVSILRVKYPNADFTAQSTCLTETTRFDATGACIGNAFQGSGSSSGAAAAADSYPTKQVNFITMAAWVKWSGTIANGSSQAIMMNGHAGLSGYGLYIDGTTKNLTILLGGVAFLTSSVKLTPNKWQNVAIVRNNGSWILYVDGLHYPVSNPTTTPRVPGEFASGKFSVGQNVSGGENFIGSIDEVAIWDRALNMAEINGLRADVCYSSPTGSWNFNETSGAQALDGSGNNLHLTLNNAQRVSQATYAWDFGDGKSQTTDSPATSHQYLTHGTKTVKLTVTDITGCSSSTTQVVSIVTSAVSFPVTATISSTEVCIGTAINLSASSIPSVYQSDFNGHLNDWQLGEAWQRNTYYVGSGPAYAANTLVSITAVNRAINSTLTSPAFSTVGLTSVSVFLTHYLRNENASKFSVEASSDGNNWATLVTYNDEYREGGRNKFKTDEIVLPTAYENKEKVYMRFRYVDTQGNSRFNFWMIQSVAVRLAGYRWTSVPKGYSSNLQGEKSIVPLVTTTYSLSANNGCGGTASQVTVTVKALPTATITGAGNVCKDAPSPAVTFTGSGSVGPYTFRYRIISPTEVGPEQTITTTSGNSVTITAPTSVIGRFDYDLLAVSTPTSCVTEMFSRVSVIVAGYASATISAPSDLCQLATGNVRIEPSGGTFPYTLNYTDPANVVREFVLASASTRSMDLPIQTDKAGDQTYKLISVQSGNGCSVTFPVNDQPSATIRIQATPDVSVESEGSTFCDAPIKLTASGAHEYKWFPAIGLNQTTGNVVEASPVETTTYKVTGTVNGCSKVVTKVINSAKLTITRQPTISATEVCAGTAVTLTGGESKYSGIFIYEENFDSQARLANWTGTTTTSINGTWKFYPDKYRFLDIREAGSGFIYTESHRQNDTHQLIRTLKSPAISTLGYTNIAITINEVASINTNPNSVQKVQLSLDGVSWTDVFVRKDPLTSEEGKVFFDTKIEVPTTFENKPTVYIRLFSHVEIVSGDGGLSFWGINNIRMTCSRPAYWSWNQRTLTLNENLYQNPSVIRPETSTEITAFTTTPEGCTKALPAQVISVNPVPEVSIDPLIRVEAPTSIQTAQVPYTKGTGEPDRYSLFAGARKLPGFVNQTDFQFPTPTVFGVNVPPAIATYDFIFKAGNRFGCAGKDVNFSIIVGSGNSFLSALTLSTGPLSPAFDPSVTYYGEVAAPAAMESVTVTATVTHPGASLIINDLPAISGAPTVVPLDAAFGRNTISVKVTSEAGTELLYQIPVIRAPNIDNVGHDESNAKAAYSLRKLGTVYQHGPVTPLPPVPGFTNSPTPALRVRRSYDNAMLDIGFDANGHLDTLTMLQFAGPAELFVPIWYDQSGGNMDAFQTDPGSQPRIAHGRHIDRKSGVPTLYFTGSAASNGYLNTAPFQGFSDEFSIYAVAGVKEDQTANLNAMVSKTSDGKPAPFAVSGATFKIGDGNTSISTVNLQKAFIAANPFASWFFMGKKAFDVGAWFNSERNEIGFDIKNGYADSNTPLVIGSDQQGESRLNGWVSEVILLPKSIRYQTITESQMQYYLGPVIASFSPEAGEGRVEITIRGYNFLGATQVTIGGVPMGFQVVDDNVITLLKPPGAGGELTVTTPLGTGKKTGFFNGTPPGNALVFDGADDYVRLANKMLFPNFTIETWIRTAVNSKTGDAAYQGSILLDSDVSGRADDFVLSVLNNKIAFLDGSADVNTFGTTRVTDGRWHHVAVVREAGQSVKIYVDGNLDATGPAGANPLTANPFVHLGGVPNNVNVSFQGSMDELRIWDRTFDQETLNAIRFEIPQRDHPALTTRLSFDVNTGVRSIELPNLSRSGGFATLNNFIQTGSAWTESYAMVVPDTSPPVDNITETGFTAHWSPAPVGTSEMYWVYLSKDPTVPFASPETRMYGATDTSLRIEDLEPQTTYYYRIGCFKGYLGDQSALSKVETVTTLYNPDLIALSLNGAALAAFEREILSYTASIGEEASSVVISATLRNPSSTIAVKVNDGNYTPLATGTPSGPLNMDYGVNVISIQVSSPNGSAATTYVITVTRPFSPPGNALRFAGSKTDVNLEEYVQIDRKIESPDFTLETWIRTSENSTTGSQGFSATALFNSDKGGTANDFTMGILNNKIAFFDGNKNATTIGEVTVTDDRWHHVAVVRKAGISVKIYIDGKLDKENTTGAGTAALNANSYIALGGNPGYAPVAFHGLMDEVRIWKVARSEADLLANMLQMVSPTHPDLMASYNFDTGNQENAASLTDLTGNGKTGTLYHFDPANINWIESYAVVVPVALGASAGKSTEFVANWSAPAVGIADRYLLDVSTSQTFAAGSFLPGYEALEVTETSKKVILPTTGRETAGTNYYYRVRADKASVPGQGGYSGTITFTANPLPVNLISFTGKKVENINLLEWEVTDETQFSGYEVQRSSNGKSFTTIGRVNAISNEQSGVTRYRFSDSLNLAAGSTSDNFYYRLKMIDIDSSFALSRIVVIKNESGKTRVSSLYPNPVVNKSASVDITVNRAESWQVSIYNVAGTLVKSGKVDLAKGINKVTLDLRTLSSGLHLLKFSTGAEMIAKTILVE
ncbi:LamG domain-containing protein [Dyadobacter sp. CY261]|uniref:LamG-like jellyroll fold domain-containing protein n=1 Tax=Dyadobacter sp. CY261 TaxID=2907203 RepID=UPI001F31B275|nr:LamG-like jellyroll fold domain-containing protein [Dyadobacter sp. CY261]MCF0075499.1 LamG domain-containing protein [Dyadobacter sp. CY261]